MNHHIWHVQILLIFRPSSNLEALRLVSIVSENRSAPLPHGPPNLLLSMSGRLQVCWESSNMLPHKTQHTSSQKMKTDAHPRNLTTSRMLCVAYKKCCRTELSHQKIRVNQLSNCGSTVMKENVSFKLPDYKSLFIRFIHILVCILQRKYSRSTRIPYDKNLRRTTIRLTLCRRRPGGGLNWNRHYGRVTPFFLFRTWNNDVWRSLEIWCWYIHATKYTWPLEKFTVICEKHYSCPYEPYSRTENMDCL